MGIIAGATESVYKIQCGKIEFELTEARIDDSLSMGYTAYGIRAVNGAGEVAAYYPDISTSKEFVLGFLALIEGHDIAEAHIRDILEDYLC